MQRLNGAITQCMFVFVLVLCNVYTCISCTHVSKAMKMGSLKINSNFVSDYNEEIHFAVDNVS